MASWLAPVEITIGELLIETSVPLLILIEILLVFLIMLSKRWMAFKFLHNKGIAFTLSTTSLLLLTEKKITLPAILVLILSPILKFSFTFVILPLYIAGITFTFSYFLYNFLIKEEFSRKS